MTGLAATNEAIRLLARLTLAVLSDNREDRLPLANTLSAVGQAFVELVRGRVSEPYSPT